MSSWVITGVSRGLGVRSHPCFMNQIRVTNTHTSSSSSSSSASSLKTRPIPSSASLAIKPPSSPRLPLKSAGKIFTSFRPTQRTQWHWRYANENSFKPQSKLTQRLRRKQLSMFLRKPMAPLTMSLPMPRFNLRLHWLALILCKF